MDTQPSALVIGFTVHGLAVARSLSRHGVRVHAFTLPEGRFTATRFTRHATVHIRDNLNSDALIPHLEEFGRRQAESERIVLFPTSDRMTSAIGRHWDRLKGRYLLSWSHCRDLVLSMQRKDSLPALAASAGILHPETARIDGQEDIESAVRRVGLPCVVKPVMPLSSFKAVVVQTTEQVRQLASRYAHDLPFLAQQLIPGDEDRLYSCTTYLDRGRELAIMTSRKLYAWPPGTGQGVVFATEENGETTELTRQLLAGLDLSGPVAVEYKRDADGRYWMIEPNVGRTEYCVDLAIQSGVDMPWIEYCQVTGTPPRAATTPARSRIWFDTDRDGRCYRRYRDRYGADAIPEGAAVFPFAGTGDPLPLAISRGRQVLEWVKDTLRPSRKTA